MKKGQSEDWPFWRQGVDQVTVWPVSDVTPTKVTVVLSDSVIVRFPLVTVPELMSFSAFTVSLPKPT